jgi:hypothetical protein
VCSAISIIDRKRIDLQTFLKKVVFLGWQLDFTAKEEFYVSCLCPIKYKAAVIKAIEIS